MITKEAFNDCLSWEKANTPFIPFTNMWERALERRRLIREGKRDVVIIAIWSKGLRNVDDAYEVAGTIGYCNDDSNPRKRLADHLDKYLVFNGVLANEYRVLAIFKRQNETENVKFTILGLEGSATVPNTSIKAKSGEIANEELENIPAHWY